MDGRTQRTAKNSRCYADVQRLRVLKLLRFYDLLSFVNLAKVPINEILLTAWMLDQAIIKTSPCLMKYLLQECNLLPRALVFLVGTHFSPFLTDFLKPSKKKKAKFSLQQHQIASFEINKPRKVRRAPVVIRWYHATPPERETQFIPISMLFKYRCY
jgi:hypothetical protein